MSRAWSTAVKVELSQKEVMAALASVYHPDGFTEEWSASVLMEWTAEEGKLTVTLEFGPSDPKSPRMHVRQGRPT